MKVMCIKDVWLIEPGIEHIPHPKCGDIDIVVDEFWRRGKLYYELDRLLGFGCAVENFIPISDIDETELVKEREGVEVVL